MKISNVRVYGLEESILASGYPMQTQTPDESEFDVLDYDICSYIHKGYRYLGSKENAEKQVKRMKHLGNAAPGSGHDCALKGIIVQADIKAPEYWWRQFDRYHFRDYISSQSKMHCILKFNIEDMVNKYVDKRVIEVLKEKIKDYNENPSPQNFQTIISNVPAGLELTARITTNYLQLKTIYNQRKNHKLEEWREIFCPWIKTLPCYQLITGEVQ